jgi:hypothetical protein
MAEYNSILNAIVASMGSQDTDSSELQRRLEYLNLKPCQVGTRIDYDARRRLINDGKMVPLFGIYNTMDGPPGQHWFCCYGSYKYDPLGDDSSDTQEQPDSATDCGQRCIAYLVMCNKYKRPIKL